MKSSTDRQLYLLGLVFTEAGRIGATAEDLEALSAKLANCAKTPELFGLFSEPLIQDFIRERSVVGRER